MFRRHTPRLSLFLVRLGYLTAILGASTFGLVLGWIITAWWFGLPPGEGLAKHSPFYIQAWIHWIVSYVLAACLLALPFMAASMMLACSIARAHAPLDGAWYSWLGSLEVGLEYDPVARRHRLQAFMEDLKAYANSSAGARQEVEQFLSAGKEFQNRDGDWLVKRLTEAGLHSRFKALSPAQRAVR